MPERFVPYRVDIDNGRNMFVFGLIGSGQGLKGVVGP